MMPYNTMQQDEDEPFCSLLFPCNYSREFVDEENFWLFVQRIAANPK